MSADVILEQLRESRDVLEAFMQSDESIGKINAAADAMVESILNGGKIIACGNGGSMSDAMHFAEELTGRFREGRKSLPAIAISDPGYLTCTANDFGYDAVFSRFVEGLGQRNDVLLAISTSGHSKNVLQAAHTAKKKGLTVVSLTGKDGGDLAKTSNIEIRVPHFGYADRIQEVHIKIIHCFITLIEHRLNF